MNILTTITPPNGAGGDFAAGGFLTGSIGARSAPAGAMAHLSQLIIDEPNITLTGGDSVTNASTLYIRSSPTEGDNDFTIYSAGTAQSYFAGNVGIGTTDIAQKLHVNGNVAIDGNITLSGSIVVGSPTGGDKGAGTINATAVYDDNVLLTDYVFDKYFDGKVREEDQERYGNYQLKSLDEMAVFIERERHLPTMVGREQWKEAEGKLPLGKIVTQLWETVETQAIYIKELKGMLVEQKEEIERLKEERKPLSYLRDVKRELLSRLE